MRADGFYWVRLKGWEGEIEDWGVAEYNNSTNPKYAPGYWNIVGSSRNYDDSDFDTIDEQQIKNPHD